MASTSTRTQNNPFQPDVNYRGYTASPLVGSPAGLSVYLDGVRQNQPFGDVVAWDLIPKVAISDTELIPGSNPVYGLNTLGGAIAIQTKSGTTSRGFAISGYRRQLRTPRCRRRVRREATIPALNWFAAGTVFHEDGWRVESPSSVRQSFAKLGYDHGATTLSLSGGYAINDLTGNGTQDIRAIARTTGLNHGYDSVYSIPDRTWQHSPFLTFNATHAFSKNITFNGNAYFRFIRTNTTNGDINDGLLRPVPLPSEQRRQSRPHRRWNPLSPIRRSPPRTHHSPISAASRRDSGSTTQANAAPASTPTPSTSSTPRVPLESSPGAPPKTSSPSAPHGIMAASTFVQTAQYGYLNPDGITVTRIPTFLDGSTSVDGDPAGQPRQPARHHEHAKLLPHRHPLSSANGSSPPPAVTTTPTSTTPTASPPSTIAAPSPAINTFDRFNPSAGRRLQGLQHPQRLLRLQRKHAAPLPPTELGCADPNFPCSLPNALVSDPPLKQVVSRTLEAGMRGNRTRSIRWSLGFFHTNNDDDLLFVASQQTGYGYFQKLRADPPPRRRSRRLRAPPAPRRRCRVHLPERHLPKPASHRQRKQQHQQQRARWCPGHHGRRQYHHHSG